jgi:type IV pilus assembly protein PilX
MNIRIFNRRKEKGAILIVSLILLLVMTVLALSASQMTRMQERMAANSRDRDLALQSAEAGLRNGERLIEALGSAPIPCTAVSPRCSVYANNALPVDIGFQTAPWWDSTGWRYGTSDTTWSTTVANAMVGSGMVRSDPSFVVEEVEEVPDTLTIPPTGPPPSRFYYRVTSAAEGGTATSQVVLRSTFARRY